MKSWDNLRETGQIETMNPGPDERSCAPHKISNRPRTTFIMSPQAVT